MRLQRHIQSPSNKGNTLLEITAVLVLIGLIMASLVPRIMGQIEGAKVETTMKEMNSLLQASLIYKKEQNKCPMIIDMLGRYIYAPVISNPFNQSYVISCGPSTVTITSNLPKGVTKSMFWGPLMELKNIGVFDEIKITGSIDNFRTGRILYENKPKGGKALAM